MGGITMVIGRHIIVELYDCDADILNNRQLIEQILVEAALQAGAEVREVAFHKFAPQGVSGVVIISESHLTIHTYPELKYAAVDLFTCGNKSDPWKAYAYIAQHLKAKEVQTWEFKRGTKFDDTRKKTNTKICNYKKPCIYLFVEFFLIIPKRGFIFL